MRARHATSIVLMGVIVAANACGTEPVTAQRPGGGKAASDQPAGRTVGTRPPQEALLAALGLASWARTRFIDPMLQAQQDGELSSPADLADFLPRHLKPYLKIVSVAQKIGLLGRATVVDAFDADDERAEVECYYAVYEKRLNPQAIQRRFDRYRGANCAQNGCPDNPPAHSAEDVAAFVELIAEFDTLNRAFVKLAVGRLAQIYGTADVAQACVERWQDVRLPPQPEAGDELSAAQQRAHLLHAVGLSGWFRAVFGPAFREPSSAFLASLIDPYNRIVQVAGTLGLTHPPRVKSLFDAGQHEALDCYFGVWQQELDPQMRGRWHANCPQNGECADDETVPGLAARPELRRKDFAEEVLPEFDELNREFLALALPVLEQAYADEPTRACEAEPR